MTSPATRLPNWASDSTIAAGVDAGLATRLDPGLGIEAQGHQGDRRTAARHANWLGGAQCEWLAYLAGVGVRNWQPLVTGAEVGVSATPTRLVGFKGRWLWLMNRSAAGATVGPLLPALGGPTASLATTAVTSTYGAYDAACGGTSMVYASIPDATETDTRCISDCTWANGTGADYTVVDAGQDDYLGRVMCTNRMGAGTYVAHSRDDIYRSVDYGATWTEVSPATLPGSVQTFCADPANGAGGSSRLVLTYSGATSSDPCGLLYSDDDGVTWLDAPASTGLALGVARVSGRFLFLDEAGELFYLADAASVCLSTGVTLTGYAGVDALLSSWDMIAGDGGRMVVAAVKDPFGGGIAAYVSTDAGATFALVPIDADPIVTDGAFQVAYSADQFAIATELTDAGYCAWVSGRLGNGALA